MKKLKKLAEIVLAIGLGVGGSKLIAWLFGKALKAAFPNYFVLEFVMQLISAAIGLGLIFLFRKEKVLKFSGKDFKEGLACGAPILVIVALSAVSLIPGLSGAGGHQMIRWWEILLLALQCILIGFYEEAIFRGIVQELSFEIVGGDTLNKARTSIAMATFFFAVLHLKNAISPQISLKAAAMQAISVFWLGLVFGAICYRCGRTIWASVLIHAILDFSAFVASGILFGITQEEAIGATGSDQAISSVIYVIWFLYLMRSRRDEEE